VIFAPRGRVYVYGDAAYHGNRRRGTWPPPVVKATFHFPITRYPTPRRQSRYRILLRQLHAGPRVTTYFVVCPPIVQLK
jgi:hypothetical protein